MADGSVRFVGENISDAAFKAMATIKGGAPDDFDINRDAPKVAAPAKGGTAAPMQVPAKQGAKKPAAPMKEETNADEGTKKADPPPKEEKKADKVGLGTLPQPADSRQSPRASLGRAQVVRPSPVLTAGGAQRRHTIVAV